MGNQNEGDNRQTQGTTGQRTNPHDPKIDPERDDPNQIERRTSDEGQGRDQSGSGKRSSAGEPEVDDLGNEQSAPGRSKSGATGEGQSPNRGGNP